MKLGVDVGISWDRDSGRRDEAGVRGGLPRRGFADTEGIVVSASYRDGRRSGPRRKNDLNISPPAS